MSDALDVREVYQAEIGRDNHRDRASDVGNIWDYLELFGNSGAERCSGSSASQFADRKAPYLLNGCRVGHGRGAIVVSCSKLTPRTMYPRSDASHQFAIDALGLDRDPGPKPCRAMPPVLPKLQKPRPRRRGLTSVQVDIIRTSDMRGTELARMFGVSQSAISHIRKGRLYSPKADKRRSMSEEGEKQC